MQPEIILAYAAGIFEGEGSTAAYYGSGPTRRGLVFAVSVWQSKYTLLHWLEQHFGGGVYGRNGAGYGVGSRKVAGEWRATGNGGYFFLKAIRPYLVFRQAEVDVMIDIWEKRADREEVARLCDYRKEVRK